MESKVKVDTENFLHNNPSLYLAFNEDQNNGMAHFIHMLFKKYKVGKKILDIGSGLGREVSYLNESGYEVIGIDNSDEMVAWAKQHYPKAKFILGNQSEFSLDEKFDGIFCVGSTFLYNLANEDALATLKCFRRHLKAGGFLYLDMRNAAFFLTKEGQRWITEELVDQTIWENRVATLNTRFSIDLKTQILERDYCWNIEGYEPIVEHLKHRLFFPQELINYLNSNGFEVLNIFDKPAPHVGKYDANGELVFTSEMTGTRMQIIAQAI